MDDDTEILVLGIGNLLWADDGFGVRAVEELQRRYHVPEDRVRLVDGGTQGLYLVPMLQAARRVIVFDAVDYKLAPGTLKVLRGDEVPRLGGGKIDMHQTSFQDVLATVDILGNAPDEIVVIGVQPAVLDAFGASLSDPVRDALSAALAVAVEQLAAWDAPARPRTGTPDAGEALFSTAIGRAAYERRDAADGS